MRRNVECGIARVISAAIAAVLAICLCLPTAGLAYAAPAGETDTETTTENSSQLASSESQETGTCYPTATDIAAWEADGTLEDRIAFQEALGNDQTSSTLIQNAKSQSSSAFSLKSNNLPASNQSYMSLSATGNARVIALYVSFPAEEGGEVLTFAEGDDLAALQRLIGRQLDGTSTAIDNSAFAPYDSLSAYYGRSSYGKLNISGTAVEYTAQNPRSYYTNNADALFAEAIISLDATINFAEYDGNADGYIDAVYLHFVGGNTGWGSTWWSNEKFYAGTEVIVDGKQIGGTVTLHNPSNNEEGLRTAIHETGHLLGLPDYYSYYASMVERDPSNRTGILTFDMMNNNLGDHNAFSKWLLGWIDNSQITRIVANESGITVKQGDTVESFAADEAGEASVQRTLELLASADPSECGGFIAVSNDNALLGEDGLFSSFYLLEYNAYEGNQAVTYRSNWSEACEIPAGFRLFRIQADLDGSGSSFFHSNRNDDVHNQLIELVDVDGESYHAQFIGAADSAYASTYGCMLLAGSSVTPEGYPSTNFRENINLGFTGLTFMAMETAATQGIIEISYSPELKPNLSPDALSLSMVEPRAVLSTDCIQFTGNIPLVEASTYDLPYLSIGGTCVFASASVEDGIVTFAYAFPPELFTPGGTCEAVFPAGYFIIGEQNGETIYSNEIRIELTMGDAATFSAVGNYEGAVSNTYTMTELFACSDGLTHFVVKNESNFTLCTVDPADPTSISMQTIDGINEPNGYTLDVAVTEDGFCLLASGYSNGVPFRNAYWVDSKSASVTNQAALPTDSYTILASSSQTIFMTAFERDSITFERILTLQSFEPEGDGQAETHRWEIYEASGIAEVTGAEGLMSVTSYDPSTGMKTAFVVDLAQLIADAEENGVVSASYAAFGLPSVVTLDLSAYSGISALAKTDAGYLGLAYNEPEAVGSPDLDSQANDNDGSQASEGGTSGSVIAWENKTDVKGKLVTFGRQGSVEDERCFITYGNGSIAFDRVSVSNTGAIAASITLDPSIPFSLFMSESRLTLLFKSSIHDKPVFVGNESPSWGMWLHDGTWLETSWNRETEMVFTEGQENEGGNEPGASDSSGLLPVHYLVMSDFATGGNDPDDSGGESGDEAPTGPGGSSDGPNQPGNAFPDAEIGESSTDLSSTGDATPTAALALVLLAGLSLAFAAIARVRQES